MIESNLGTGIVTITCDKCGESQSTNEIDYSKIFYINGWGLNRNAKKYFHLCHSCQSSNPKKGGRK